uniref:Uncharacterized protein n=1 Tax=Physcomitrium patens TaxID=3218 RepID=A0A7I3Z324_PHYPA
MCVVFCFSLVFLFACFVFTFLQWIFLLTAVIFPCASRLRRWGAMVWWDRGERCRWTGFCKELKVLIAFSV